MGERDDPQLGRSVQAQRAERLMNLLGLSEDELCQALAVDPLTLLSGQLQHNTELPILLTLLDEAAERTGAALLKAWARSGRPGGRPVDVLTQRDFAAFEDKVSELKEHGFVLRGGG
jgi:hypothetical protein